MCSCHSQELAPVGRGQLGRAAAALHEFVLRQVRRRRVLARDDITDAREVLVLAGGGAHAQHAGRRTRDVAEVVRGVGRHVDRGPGPYRVLLAAEGELDLALEDREHLLEVMPVRRRAAAVGDAHLDQAVPAVGLLAGDQHGVRVAHQRDVRRTGVVGVRHGQRAGRVVVGNHRGSSFKGWSGEDQAPGATMTTLPCSSPAAAWTWTAGSSASGTRRATSTRSSPESTSATSRDSCSASLLTNRSMPRTPRVSSLGAGIHTVVFTSTPPERITVSSPASRAGSTGARLSTTSTGSVTAAVTSVAVWSTTSSAPADPTCSLLRGPAVAITYAPAFLASCTA